MRNGWHKTRDGDLVLVRETRDGWVIESKKGRRTVIRKGWLR